MTGSTYLGVTILTFLNDLLKFPVVDMVEVVPAVLLLELLLKRLR